MGAHKLKRSTRKRYETKQNQSTTNSIAADQPSVRIKYGLLFICKLLISMDIFYIEKDFECVCLFVFFLF